MHVPDWPKIIEEMYVRLPSPRYLDFVASTLLCDKPIAKNIDPFAVEVPNVSTDYYVDRDEIEREILLPGTRIILGKYGTGKTTLFNKLSFEREGKDTLIVKIALNKVGYQQPDAQAKPEDRSPLCIKNMIRLVFNAYWEDFILPASPHLYKPEDAHQKYMPWFRREPQWMRLLSWFYHHFPPQHQTVPDDFELMAWLEYSKGHELLGSQIESESILRELIRLIFYKTETKDLRSRPFGPRYHKVTILIDGAETLSSAASKNLLLDFQHLIDQKIPNVDILIFAENSKMHMFENLECVQDGRVAIYELPAWKNEQLSKILALRRYVCISGTFNIDDAWAMMLPLSCIQYSARSKLVENLVKGSRSPEKTTHRFDTPVHLLKLTRGIIAACAGCWENYGLMLPICQEDIDEIIKGYWHHISPLGGADHGH
jgi:hypothetical protein